MLTDRETELGERRKRGESRGQEGSKKGDSRKKGRDREADGIRDRDRDGRGRQTDSGSSRCGGGTAHQIPYGTPGQGALTLLFWPRAGKFCPFLFRGY